MHILGYLIAAGIGFLAGVVVSCILLAQKNLKIAQSLENSIEDSAKGNFEAAKAVYKASVAEYENGDADETNEFDETEEGEE